MIQSLVRRRAAGVVCALATLAIASAVQAVDINGVESAALDQPRINAYISTSANGSPLTASDQGVDSFNIEAYYDTGASGVLLSTNTAALLGINPATYNGTEIRYSDVGVAGTSDFYVSNPLYISLSAYHPNRDIDNPNTYSTVYNQHFGPIRTQIGPADVEPDPALGDLDVFGMPTMTGKVVVMDPKPVNSFFDTMRTYVYEPGTPFNSGAQSTNPGIPSVDKHVKLSYVSFDRFTQVTPAGAPGPSLKNNPFIGPNPFASPGTDTTPPVTVSFGGVTKTGSFLLDTGAAASMLSQHKAAELGVTYDPNTVDSDSPRLMYQGQPIADQFQLTIGGIGGSKVVSGFYLDSLLLKTDEGVAANDNNLNLNFTRAPVLVSDVSVQNPLDPSDTFTLDGIFGMNYLVASAEIAGVDSSGFPLIGNLSFGKFDWVTFDEPNGRLGLKVASPSDQDYLTWNGDFFDPDHTHWDTTSPFWSDGQGPFATYQDGDRVLFNDQTLSTTIRVNEVLAPGGITFDNNMDEDGEFGTDFDLIGTGHITGFTGLIKRGTAELRISLPNDYTGATVVEAGMLIFFRGQNIGPLSVAAGAETLFATTETQRIESISVAGSLVIESTAHVITKAIAVDPGGQIQMNDAKLIVGNPDGQLADAKATAQAIREVLHDGGIVSALVSSDPRLAIGYVEAAVKFSAMPATWNGEAVKAGQVLVAVTRRGDTNLDLVVNFQDLVALAQHYNNNGQIWSGGDFNYDGIVNFSDLVSLAQNYNTSRPATIEAMGFDSSFATDWALAQSFVPEPTAMMAGMGLVLAVRRRRV